jgi:hypothetical protein
MLSVTSAAPAVITCVPISDDIPSGTLWLAHDTALHNQLVDGPNSPGEDKTYRAQIVSNNQVPCKNAKLILTNTASGKGTVVGGVYQYMVMVATSPPKGQPEFNDRGDRNGGASFRFYLANLDTCEIVINLPGFDFNKDEGINTLGSMITYVGALS